MKKYIPYLAGGLITAVGLGVGLIFSTDSDILLGLKSAVKTYPSATVSYFRADSSPISLGKSTVLRWETRNALYCSLSTYGNVKSIGTKTVTPQKTIDYNIACIGRDGRIARGTTRIVVTPMELPAPIVTISSSSGSIAPGSSTTISWSGSYVTSCNLDITPFNGNPSDLGGANSSKRDITMKPTMTTTYTVTCSQPQTKKVVKAGTTVYVTPPIVTNGTIVATGVTISSISTTGYKENTGFYFPGTRLPKNSKINILAKNKNGTTNVQATMMLSGDGRWYAQFPRGLPAGNYTLEARNAALTTGEPLASNDLLITSSKTHITSVPSVIISANPTTIASGSNTRISWSGSNVTSCMSSTVLNGTSANWMGSTSTKGSVSVQPTTKTKYTVVCSDATTGITATGSTTINVSNPQPITISFAAGKSSDGDGDGIITSLSPNVKCIGNLCIGNPPIGTQVSLQATPIGGYKFNGWIGCDNYTGGNICNIMITSARKSAEALFIRLIYDKVGPTLEQINALYLSILKRPGDQAGMKWMDATNYSEDDISAILLNSPEYQALVPNKTNQYLYLNITGSGKVESVPLSINCIGASCAKSLTENTKVTLIATPSPGYTFMSWTGSCSGTQNSCSLTMTGTKTAIAIFNVSNASICDPVESRFMNGNICTTYIPLDNDGPTVADIQGLYFSLLGRNVDYISLYDLDKANVSVSDITAMIKESKEYTDKNPITTPVSTGTIIIKPSTTAPATTKRIFGNATQEIGRFAIEAHGTSARIQNIIIINGGTATLETIANSISSVKLYNADTNSQVSAIANISGNTLTFSTINDIISTDMTRNYKIMLDVSSLERAYGLTLALSSPSVTAVRDTNSTPIIPLIAAPSMKTYTLGIVPPTVTVTAVPSLLQDKYLAKITVKNTDSNSGFYLTGITLQFSYHYQGAGNAPAFSGNLCLRDEGSSNACGAAGTTAAVPATQAGLTTTITRAQLLSLSTASTLIDKNGQSITFEVYLDDAPLWTTGDNVSVSIHSLDYTVGSTDSNESYVGVTGASATSTK